LPVGFRFDDAIRSFRHRLLDERRDSHAAQRRSVLDLLRQSRWETSVDALRRRSRRAMNPVILEPCRLTSHIYSK
jgi:hypothetical protein